MNLCLSALPHNLLRHGLGWGGAGESCSCCEWAATPTHSTPTGSTGGGVEARLQHDVSESVSGRNPAAISWPATRHWGSCLPWTHVLAHVQRVRTSDGRRNPREHHRLPAREPKWCQRGPLTAQCQRWQQLPPSGQCQRAPRHEPRCERRKPISAGEPWGPSRQPIFRDGDPWFWRNPAHVAAEPLDRECVLDGLPGRAPAASREHGLRRVCAHAACARRRPGGHRECSCPAVTQ
jgi:hypothetical protein